MRLTLGLLLVLVGCATPPTVRGPQWQLHGGAVDVDFEQPPAQQAEQLRQRGVHLPTSSRFGLSAGVYRGAGGALIVPTVFSPATTPRIARTMLQVRQHLSETTQRELEVQLLNLTGTRVLQGIFSRVVRVGPEPEAPGSPRHEG
jgi:hypothetical protein